ncbi:type II toxin-antitoxin system Phd/YefM family antitoxin [Cupriavidus agavae]|uniref:Antitoxin n=1 Tax=Cupriavidus agavae TaxID=1001822 RepID=A0A4Q7S923_9BURK|nr:type II toxin-antitoxin system Phd/YefM family antitoxin [Cupriavidus agavae]RZT42280.1 prevent-host-death family protein [Cupriavidus agavae]
MQTVNIHEAKTNLSRLIEAVAEGQEVVIAKAGKPMVRMVPFATPQTPRRLGGLKGKMRIADDFDAPLPDDLLAAFEGR